MNSRRSHPQSHPSDQVVAHVADLLMTLALDFESNHLGEILRHRQQLRWDEAPSVDPRQLPLFPDLPPF